MEVVGVGYRGMGANEKNRKGNLSRDVACISGDPSYIWRDWWNDCNRSVQLLWCNSEPDCRKAC